MFSLLVLVGFVGCCQAFLFSRGPDWDGLAVTWGPNPLSKQYFVQMPRTEEEAQSKGWQKNGDCSEPTFYRGNRYILDNDPAVMLLYDVNGYIAGIQTGIPRWRNWPKSTLKYANVFNRDADQKLRVETAYFVPPGEICSGGRTEEQFNKQGTGTGLYLQQGPDPVRDSVSIPLQESDMPNTKWTKGRCFPTMGQHYWYNVTEDMSCDDFYPGFLMYNDHRLNAFGFALDGDFSSPRYEHPTPDVFNKFLNPVPTCLMSKDLLSTIHIYFDNHPMLNFC